MIGRSAVGRNHTTQCADFANVADECAGIKIPDDRNLVAVQIKMRGFGGAPVRSDLGEFTHDERFDVRLACFFIVEIRANISDVGIGQTNNLPGVAGIGEHFLIAGEAGIENNFSAAARDRASRAAVKYAPVLERQNCGSMQNFGQCVLRCSFFQRFDRA